MLIWPRSHAMFNVYCSPWCQGFTSSSFSSSCCLWTHYQLLRDRICLLQLFGGNSLSLCWSSVGVVVTREAFCNLMTEYRSFSGIVFLGCDFHQCFLAFPPLLGNYRKVRGDWSQRSAFLPGEIKAFPLTSCSEFVFENVLIRFYNDYSPSPPARAKRKSFLNSTPWGPKNVWESP